VPSSSELHRSSPENPAEGPPEAGSGPVQFSPGASLPDVIDALRPVVVQISVSSGGTLRRVGTGAWIHSSGLVVTALHVIRQAQRAGDVDGGEPTVQVGVAQRLDEQERGNFVHLSADVVAVDERRDLALLRVTPNPLPAGGLAVPGGVVPVPTAIASLDSRRVRDGEGIAVSGYPVVEPVLVTTTGTVASSWAFDLSQLPASAGPLLAELDDLYLIDATINPGDSGAPVYRTSDGTLVGICLSFRVARADVDALEEPLTYPSGLGVVVPAKYVAELIDQSSDGDQG
jgi:S1-C subfamily serine protease